MKAGRILYSQVYDDDDDNANNNDDDNDNIPLHIFSSNSMLILVEAVFQPLALTLTEALCLPPSEIKFGDLQSKKKKIHSECTQFSPTYGCGSTTAVI